MIRLERLSINWLRCMKGRGISRAYNGFQRVSEGLSGRLIIIVGIPSGGELQSFVYSEVKSLLYVAGSI